MYAYSCWLRVDVLLDTLGPTIDASSILVLPAIAVTARVVHVHLCSP